MDTIMHKGYQILPFQKEQRKGNPSPTFYLVGNEEFDSIEDAKIYIESLSKEQ